MATLNNVNDEGDSIENDAETGIHRGNTELSDENNGNIEGESNETIVCGESEVIL